MKSQKSLNWKSISTHLDLPRELRACSYDDGIRLISFALTVSPREPWLFFYLASFYSANNDLKKALWSYEQALRYGFHDWSAVWSDASLSALRATTGFKAVTARYRNKRRISR